MVTETYRGFKEMGRMAKNYRKLFKITEDYRALQRIKQVFRGLHLLGCGQTHPGVAQIELRVELANEYIS